MKKHLSNENSWNLTDVDRIELIEYGRKAEKNRKEEDRPSQNDHSVTFTNNPIAFRRVFVNNNNSNNNNNNNNNNDENYLEKPDASSFKQIRKNQLDFYNNKKKKKKKKKKRTRIPM